MATVRPFRGLRPRPDLAHEIASPPYDVLNSDEARALVRDNPNSFLRVNKPEVDFGPDTDLYSDEVYLRGKENLGRLSDEGLMIRDESPCFYLYRLTWRGRSQTGLVTLTSTEEYDRGVIKKHEHTRPVKVSDRAGHIQTLGAQVGPVFSIFRDDAGIMDIFTSATAGAPAYDFTTEDGVRHEMWVVEDEDTVRGLVDGFARLPAIYIADGHHRSAAASEVARRMREANPAHTGDEYYNFFLNVIFSDRETRILPYNRAVATWVASPPRSSWPVWRRASPSPRRTRPSSRSGLTTSACISPGAGTRSRPGTRSSTRTTPPGPSTPPCSPRGSSRRCWGSRISAPTPGSTSSEGSGAPRSSNAWWTVANAP